MLTRRFDSIFNDLFYVENESKIKCDVLSDDKEITFLFDLPDVDMNDIDISLDGGKLIVKGEIKGNIKQKYLISERMVGKFYRSFELHEHLDSSNIVASYNKGVLKVVIPKQKIIPKKIPIKIT